MKLCLEYFRNTPILEHITKVFVLTRVVFWDL